jgi:hypothetical protein
MHFGLASLMTPISQKIIKEHSLYSEFNEYITTNKTQIYTINVYSLLKEDHANIRLCLLHILFANMFPSMSVTYNQCSIYRG